MDYLENLKLSKTANIIDIGGTIALVDAFTRQRVKTFGFWTFQNLL
jgi:hypothetical protein